VAFLGWLQLPSGDQSGLERDGFPGLSALPGSNDEFSSFRGIGEVLYDVFEDGTETLGGAPLNFAVHSHQLATQLGVGYGTIVSCINSDQRGNKILDSLRRLGMSTRYLGNDFSHPTGLVSVFMRNEEPGYQIQDGAAWDYITDQPALKELAGQCNAVCFGSLAQRSLCPVSRSGVFCRMLRMRSASMTSTCDETH